MVIERIVIMARALLSVSDKSNLISFAQELAALGYELASTGGTAKALQEAGLEVTPVADITQFPEMLGGRVKTLHPNIHGGILAKRSPEQLAELETHNIVPIDLVVVNLYPFRQVVSKGVDIDTALENIDIGGPTMLRASAKNFPSVAVVVNPDDYDMVIEKLKAASLDQDTRKHLALKAFSHTAAYDAAISSYLAEGQLMQEGDFIQETGLEITKQAELRYGENPHQEASLWRLGSETGPVLDAKILQGKAMSFNNYQDADAAWNLLAELPPASVVAVKHANPCGVATMSDVAPTILGVYKLAHDADPQSIFGGIVAVNVEVGKELAEEMSKTFLEIVLAPSFSEEALAVFAKKKNLRLLHVTAEDKSKLDIRRIRGGLLIQAIDRGALDNCDLKVVTKLQPDETAWQDLRFAWTIAKHTKSNTIVLAKEGRSTGIGVGQVSRIWAAEQAIEHAGTSVTGSALASDAFFPFDDVVRLAGAHGVTSVICPGGSKRDDEVIAACDELGISMVFTGMRHFRH